MAEGNIVWQAGYILHVHNHNIVSMVVLLHLAVVTAVPVSAHLPGNLVSKVGENSPVGRQGRVNSAQKVLQGNPLAVHQSNGQAIEK